VSEGTAKLSRHHVFSPFFLPSCSVLINAAGGSGNRANIGLWAAISLIARIHPKNGNLIEKTVSERTAKLSRRNVFSPFFLPPRSVFINASKRKWQWGKHRSVGCNIIDHGFAPKMAIYL
jgi:hypothetical protein